MMPRRWEIDFNVPWFIGYTERAGGFLKDVPECHALFHYYLLARKSYEQVELGFEVQYDDSMIVSTQTHYRAQLESVATMYGVDPDSMVRYWDCVDAQCIMLDLPFLPKGERYRFNEVPKITMRLPS
jgi:hypothetical protein